MHIWIILSWSHTLARANVPAQISFVIHVHLFRCYLDGKKIGWLLLAYTNPLCVYHKAYYAILCKSKYFRPSSYLEYVYFIRHHKLFSIVSIIKWVQKFGRPRNDVPTYHPCWCRLLPIFSCWKRLLRAIVAATGGVVPVPFSSKFQSLEPVLHCWKGISTYRSVDTTVIWPWELT